VAYHNNTGRKNMHKKKKREEKKKRFQKDLFGIKIPCFGSSK
jgi:hypothetical protein